MGANPGTIGIDTNASLNEALWRFGGMHGRVLDLKGNLLHEAISLSADVNVAKISVALAGTDRTGFKPGRQTREGTLTVQKLDTAWELNIYRWLNMSLDEQRALRGSDEALMRPFSLIIEHDDPGALGYEQWQVDGCLIWQMSIAMNIGEELLQKQIPISWERETPLHAFERTGQIASNGLPAVQYVGVLDGPA
jgi:hypothetical protein